MSITDCLTCQQIFSAPTVQHPAATDMEGYCVDSGRPVRFEAGDRCRDHGAADTPCTAALRPAQCQHPHLSPNHPHPHCSECGRDLTPST